MLTKHKPKGLNKAEFFEGIALCMSGVMLTHAEPIYRCGEAYSTSSQCARTAATEVKPTSVLHTSEPNKNTTTASDLREAQALEKQRMQAERQITPATAINPTTNALGPAHISSNGTLTSKTERKGKSSHLPQSLYFTAVDPNAVAKKKSTAKAVPQKSTSQP